jgi:hypothetical protein
VSGFGLVVHFPSVNVAISEISRDVSLQVFKIQQIKECWETFWSLKSDPSCFGLAFTFLFSSFCFSSNSDKDCYRHTWFYAKCDIPLTVTPAKHAWAKCQPVACAKILFHIFFLKNIM